MSKSDRVHIKSNYWGSLLSVRFALLDPTSFDVAYQQKSITTCHAASLISAYHNNVANAVVYCTPQSLHNSKVSFSFPVPSKLLFQRFNSIQYLTSWNNGSTWTLNERIDKVVSRNGDEISIFSRVENIKCFHFTSLFLFRKIHKKV